MVKSNPWDFFGVLFLIAFCFSAVAGSMFVPLAIVGMVCLVMSSTAKS